MNIPTNQNPDTVTVTSSDYVAMSASNPAVPQHDKHTLIMVVYMGTNPVWMCDILNTNQDD